MTRLLVGVLAGLIMLAACEEKKRKKPAPAPVSAPAAAAPAGPNAADGYKACAARLSSDLNLSAGEVTFTAKGPSIAEGSPGGTWPQAVARLKANQPLVADLMKATALDRCDFGFPAVTARTAPQEMDSVVNTVGKMRALARLLKADAGRCWSEKDLDGAVDRVVAIYGMGAHLGRTSVVIAALTDAALIQLANDMARTMAEGAGGQSLKPEHKQRLRAAMDRLDPADPAGLTRSRKAEGDAAGIEQQLDRTQSKLMQDMARTRQVLGGR